MILIVVTVFFVPLAYLMYVLWRDGLVLAWRPTPPGGDESDD